MNATVYGVFHIFCPKAFSQGFAFLQNIITIKTKNNVNVKYAVPLYKLYLQGWLQ